MMSKVEKIESNINNFLLRDIVFYIDGGKTVKRGKLILFKFKEFHFNFTIKNEKNENKVYEIPYPFDYYTGERHMKFSYTLNDFTLTGSNLFYKTKTMNRDTASKLYDNVLVLSAL